MAGSIPWIIISVAALIVILGILAVMMKRKHPHPPDYYTFFVVGVIWTILGLLGRDNSSFFILGLVFMTIGLTHKKDWKKNHRTLKDMDKEERKLMYWVIISLTFLALLGLVVFLLKGGM